MLRGHHHVFLAGLLRELGPSASGIRFWLKAFGKLLVFGDGNAFVFHHPFVSAENTVQAPVNEHAEAGFVPPLHAASARGFFGGRTLWGLRGSASGPRIRRGSQGEKR